MGDECRIFTWDEAKSAKCAADRGFDFDYAVRAFEGDMLIRPDDRRDYGEARMRGIGRIEGRLFVVVFVERDGKTRIISARRARQEEWDRWPK